MKRRYRPQETSSNTVSIRKLGTFKPFLGLGTRLNTWVGRGLLSECNGERTQGSPLPVAPELYRPPTPAPYRGLRGPLRCLYTSPREADCRYSHRQTSINQSNVHKSVKYVKSVKTVKNMKVYTAVGKECRHVVRFMGPWHVNTRRLDLRPRKCPPSDDPQIQDPRSAGITGLFLGLFDVTHACAVAEGYP